MGEEMREEPSGGHGHGSWSHGRPRTILPEVVHDIFLCEFAFSWEGKINQQEDSDDSGISSSSPQSSSPSPSPFHKTGPHFPADSGNASLKKTVEDAMPIATGHEREELEAELEGRKRFDAPVGPLGPKQGQKPKAGSLRPYPGKKTVVRGSAAGGPQPPGMLMMWSRCEAVRRSLTEATIFFLPARNIAKQASWDVRSSVDPNQTDPHRNGTGK